MKIAPQLLLVLILLTFQFSTTFPGVAANENGVVTVVTHIDEPTMNIFENETIFPNEDLVIKFTIDVSAQLINPHNSPIEISLTTSSHSRIYISTDLENESLSIQDYSIISPSTTEFKEIPPGIENFQVEGELFIFDYYTKELPNGNYTLEFRYGQNQENTYHGYIIVDEGEYQYSYDEYEGQVDTGEPNVINLSINFASSIMSIMLITFLYVHQRNKR